MGAKYNLYEVIERIRCMELRFDRLQEEYHLNSKIVNDEIWFKEELQRLMEYYEGGQWLSDYEFDEQGLLPSDLKRGVLSQDAIYNFLAELND